MAHLFGESGKDFMKEVGFEMSIREEEFDKLR